MLISDTMKVMSSDSSRGMTQAADRAGSLRRPQEVLGEGGGVGDEEWFIAVPESSRSDKVPPPPAHAARAAPGQERGHHPGKAGVGWHAD
ncbi:hypothetical protein GmRootA79_30220 [Acidovorax sp. A79]